MSVKRGFLNTSKGKRAIRRDDDEFVPKKPRTVSPSPPPPTPPPPPPPPPPPLDDKEATLDDEEVIGALPSGFGFATHESIPQRPTTQTIENQDEYISVLVYAQDKAGLLLSAPSPVHLDPIPQHDPPKPSKKGKEKEGELTKKALYEVRQVEEESMGLGMFSVVDLNTGEMVRAERPIVMVPKGPLHIPAEHVNEEEGGTQEESSLEHSEEEGETQEESSLDYYEEEGETQEESSLEYYEDFLDHLINSLLRSRLSQFLSLSSRAGQGGRPLSSIIQTNGISIPPHSLVTYDSDGCELEINQPYTGVCHHLSRINHSCTPNTTFTFDPKSYTFQLYALRPIAAGEQLFVSYIDILLPPLERAKLLSNQYKFNCRCRACNPDNEESLHFRESFPTRVKDLETKYQPWLLDTQAPDDTITGPALALLESADRDGVQVTPEYGKLLNILFYTYCALGDRENTDVYRVRTFTWYASREPSQRETHLEWVNNPAKVDSHPVWRARHRLRRNAAAVKGKSV